MKKALTTLFITTSVLCLSTLLSVLVMIYGYGVQLVSYVWVIGGVFGQLLVRSALELVDNK